MTERTAWWAAVAALSAMLLAPLLLVDVPPLLDYPNHLARLVLLNAGPDDPVLGRMFTPNWTIIPNLAGDATGLVLLRCLPVHVAGRFLLGAVLLLNLAGALALHRAWFGRRSFWPLGSGLVAYNSGFLLGFLNWQIGSGLAMLSAAGWMRWRERRPRTTLICAMAAAVVLFFCHLMGLVFFVLLIGAAELRSCRSVLNRAAGLLAVLAGPSLLWTCTALREAPAAAQWPRADVKLVNAASPFINYVFALDIFTAVVIYAGIAVALAAGWLLVERRAAPILVALPIAYFVLPFDLMGAAFLDMRIALMFGFLLFAATVPMAEHQPARRIVAFGCAALFFARMTVVAEVWWEHRHDLAELRAVIAGVPPGARVYVTNIPQEAAPAWWDAGPLALRLSNGLRAEYHLPALLLIERHAFWPGLFANPAQQPIRLRPDYARLVQEAHDIPSYATLLTDPDRGLPMLRDFDFVLMLDAGAADPARFLPGCLKLTARADFAALFKVMRDAPRCAAASPER